MVKVEEVMRFKTVLSSLKRLGASHKWARICPRHLPLDLVADCASGEAQSKLFEVVKSGGKLLSIAGMPSPELAQKYNIEARFVSSNLSAKNLENGLSLVLEGKIKPIIAKTFPLAEAAQAQDFVSAGGMNGKVVLEMG